MTKVSNKFGTMDIYDIEDLGKSIYAVCTACMSVWSDLLSYANYEANIPDGKSFHPDIYHTVCTKRIQLQFQVVK